MRELEQGARLVAQTAIEGVPDPMLSSNARPTWRQKARLVKELRTATGWVARQDRPAEPMTGPVRLDVTICWPRWRKRHDQTNLYVMLKPVVDGLTDAGWWADDDQVTFGTVEQYTWAEWGRDAGDDGTRRNGCIELVAWAL